MDLMDYRRKIIANSPHLMSASGAVVSFTDGADLPLKSLIVDIDPVQSGTGDPSPTNIRPISGWNAVNVKNGNTVIATISLGQTVYGGTLNPLTGVLTVDRIVEHPTSVTGSQINNYGRCYIYTTGSVALRKQTDALAMCDMLASTIATSATFAVNQYGGANAIYFISLDSTYDTVAKYNAWLAENKPTIVLWLADPIAIQLTPHQIRSLYGNNTIFADTGNVALEYWAHP